MSLKIDTTHKHRRIRTHTHGTLALQVGTSTNSYFTGQSHRIVFLQSDSWKTQYSQIHSSATVCTFILMLRKNIDFILLSFAAKQRNQNEISLSHLLIITIYFLYTLIGVFNTCLWHYG